MTRFEYLSVLVSIVIALGISEVTVAWARVLQQKLYVRIYWLHIFWSILSVFFMNQFWWGFWRYRTVQDWSLTSLVTILFVVILLSLCALMFVSRKRVNSRFNSRATYYENSSYFFLLGGGFIVLVSVMDTAILGLPIVHTEIVFRGTGALAAFGMTITGNEKLHAGFAVLGLIILCEFLATARMY